MEDKKVKRKTRVFLLLSLIMFIIFVWGKTETQGDRRLSVYYVKKAITQSGKEIKLGWEFKGPADDPVVSIDIKIEPDNPEKVLTGFNERAKFFKEEGGI